MHRYALKAPIAGVCLLVLTSACALRRGTDGGPRSIQESPHWIQDARLREIMNELESLTVKSWPQEIEAEYSQAEQYRLAQALWEARQLADGLARAADQIPVAVSHVSMSEADRRSFAAQVDVLRDQAVRLSEGAALGDRTAMQRVLDQIDATCNSCHERFRDISGPRFRDSTSNEP